MNIIKSIGRWGSFNHRAQAMQSKQKKPAV